MSLLSPLYDMPNQSLEKQKYYQNSRKPLILRGPRAPLYVGAYTALFAVGMASTLYACAGLVLGNKAE
ncbi:Cytochrome c oxidase subunit 7, mitochondrial [Psilocybe cubensis]|uniref:Uncharacterized protein n=2 Tax=Psilocybe cubensis TaxID=181762 RepID=A0A8H8CKK9_PSICU|nr:Cytochrome c oxidase subunit 7, mitochondrial [Psilocybe cubensis]KAH9482323.1 Cytochrome c oxidase subunit 7, mitochondrial [Psilocybe cubensis]